MEFLNPTPTPKENTHGIYTNERKKREHILNTYIVKVYSANYL